MIIHSDCMMPINIVIIDLLYGIKIQNQHKVIDFSHNSQVNSKTGGISQKTCSLASTTKQIPTNYFWRIY